MADGDEPEEHSRHLADDSLLEKGIQLLLGEQASQFVFRFSFLEELPVDASHVTHLVLAQDTVVVDKVRTAVVDDRVDEVVPSTTSCRTEHERMVTQFLVQIVEARARIGIGQFD